MNQELLAKAAQIVQAGSVHGRTDGKIPYCVLALLDLDGSPTTSVITAARAKGLEQIVFCTGLSTAKVKKIEAFPRASVCFPSDTYSVTLTGDIEVSTEPSLKRENWYEALQDQFKGPADPEFCLLLFRPERYSLFLDWQEARGSL